MGIFCLWYGVSRFASDALRVNDERVLGMTGAQYLCIALVLTSAWVLLHVRKQLKGDIAAGMPVGLPGAETATDEVADDVRSEEHTSELQSLMRTSYAAFC